MSKYLEHFQSLKEKEHIEHKELSNEEIQSEIQDRRYLGELTRFMIRCFKETNFGQSLEGEQKLMFNMSMLQNASMEEFNLKAFEKDEISFLMSSDHYGSRARYVSTVNFSF